MLSLNNLDKLHKSKKRVGRGGDLGGTSGRGHKGQKARSGKKIRVGFEGGQMSISRRLPKRGFKNIFQKDLRIVNVGVLEETFNEGDVVNKESLIAAGLVKGKGVKFLLKILGNGSLSKKLEIHANIFSKSAKEMIEKTGGKVTVTQE